MEQEVDEELRRAREVYLRRATDPHLARLYEPLSPVPMYSAQQRDRAVARMLRDSGLTTLAGVDLLDVGCGAGGELRRWLTYGLEPERMAGIDLMPERIDVARRFLPQVDLRIGSAHQLPWPDQSFDVVTQYTVLSSIADPGVRLRIAAEMLRVLRPGGRILSYDMRHVAPGRADLVSIGRAELRRLFPNLLVAIRPVTLRWALVHRIIPVSTLAGEALERLPILCSHYLALITREPRLPNPD